MKNRTGNIILTILAFILLSTVPLKKEVTRASWYGPGFHGKITANGETYNQNDLTAASPTLPFNSILLVTNLDNNKSVKVRINDRGPFEMDSKGKALRPLKPHPKRGLDLSKKAFESISDLDKGIINIEFKIIHNGKI